VVGRGKGFQYSHTGEKMKIKAEYIWLDGGQTQELRSKTKVIDIGKHTIASGNYSLNVFPEWGFDGSSTAQASGKDSDCILKPVRYYKDPTRSNSYLVLCEVMNEDGTPHRSNYRNALVNAAKKYESEKAWFGIEQEYFMLDSNGIALGWPGGNYVPKAQGHYYCSVGSDRAYGRALAEEHLTACIDAGLTICGINAEVAPGQWEYQIGPVGPLEMADQLWLSRYILNKLAEKHNITIALNPKPYEGNWNGSGAHTNFSTEAMRNDGGIEVIRKACESLALEHNHHMANYGEGNRSRMTGEYETSNFDVFSYDLDSNRGHSIRVPIGTRKAGKGYMEDRRPSSNMNPYVVCRLMLETICKSI
jgi:glutamine synthetase